MRTRVALTGLLLAGTPAWGQVVDSNVAVPMRDGVVLRATVLKPAATGRFPVLVYRSPYNAASAARTYTTFRRAVERGYAVVAQDVRGRYASDGEYLPYRQEGRDGYDTIEWAAAQPWSTGEVGTFGLSYPGAVQWLAAVENPPHLRAMVPAMTFSRPTNFFSVAGLPDLSWPTWIWTNIVPDVHRRKGLPAPHTGQEARAMWETLGPDILYRVPLENVPEISRAAPWYLEWLRHPPEDPWWSWADLTTKYHRNPAAVLNISGWHDESYGPEGALTNHRGLLAARQDQADPRSYLILGPWVHGTGGMNNRRPDAAVGERPVTAAAGIDYDEEILRFMDRYVRNLPNGVERTPKVRVFVMGENAWRSGDSWPLPGTTPVTFHLHRTGTGRGSLNREPSGGPGRWTLVSNPDRPVIDPHFGSSGAHDYRSLADQEDVLVFETEPLAADLRVVGNITARLTISTDAPDTDIWVKLLDVAPDGTAWNLMSPGLDVQRLSARPGHTPLAANQPTEVILDQLLTANMFKRGHRIRIAVMTSFMPHFSRNLHTGKSEVTSAEKRIARVSVHFGPGQASTLTLPVIP